jgi:hypothetical protein
LVKITWHPWSHSCFMEIRDECARPGTMWASVALSGKSGKSKFPICVYLMVSPSGSVMVREFVADRLLLSRTWGNKKCAVAPESAIAVLPSRSKLTESVEKLSSLPSRELSSSELESDAVDAVASSDLGVRLLVMTVLSSSSSSGGMVSKGLIRVGVG